MLKTTIKDIYYCLILFLFAGCIIFYSCKRKSKAEIVSNPTQMDDKVTEIIKTSVSSIVDNRMELIDSTTLNQSSLVQYIYAQKNNEPLWSSKEQWLPVGDSLLDFISNARLWGLFPSSYHAPNLDSIRKLFFNDTANTGERRNATLWATADILLTDAVTQIVQDIKLGRLKNDTVMRHIDSALTKEFVLEKINEIAGYHSVTQVFSSLEPVSKRYHDLKGAIKNFLDSATFKTYTHVPLLKKDTLKFNNLLQQRLFEDSLIAFNSPAADSAELAKGIKRFQKKQKITVDGKAGIETIRRLNASDDEKFSRIVITLDRYKMLPAKMPKKYIFVNLPSFQLQLWENDSVKLVSKVVVGKPHTRTPVLTSAVNEMITYPKWTIPNSIIVKDILPALKRNTDYLAKKGFSLFDKEGEEVDPATVDWSKYKKGIPYNVVQGSGDANALGVLKFNFNNKYQVYLHDTNERYLFGRASRSLSHGCVRVQEWSKLAYFFISNDSLNSKSNELNKASRDSLDHWLQIKERHVISLKNKVPVFFRYFSCEGKNGSIIFYNDIYEEDAFLRQKYYSRK